MNANKPSTRKPTLVTVVNLVTLAFAVAYLAFDWWAIVYLLSH